MTPAGAFLGVVIDRACAYANGDGTDLDSTAATVARVTLGEPDAELAVTFMAKALLSMLRQDRARRRSLTWPN